MSLFDSSDTLATEQEAIDRADAQSSSTSVLEKKALPEKQAAVKQARDNVVSNRMTDIAPDTDAYDYSIAAGNGYNGSPDADGDVRLPNEGYQPGGLVVSGRDVSTGKVMTYSPEDPRYNQITTGVRMEKQETRRRAMNALEGFGAMLVGDTDTEGASGVVSGVLRSMVNGFYKYANDVNSLASFATGGYYNVPKMQELPNMGTWEGLASELTRFGGSYAAAGAAVGSSVSKLPMITQEGIKDMLAVFAMDPTEENLMTMLGVDSLDPRQMDSELMGRLANVVSDSGAATLATTAIQESIPAVKELVKWFNDNDVMLELAYTQMADDLIEDGVRQLRGGMTSFKSGLPPEVEGVAKEAAGVAINAASGVAKRLSQTRQALLQAAKGHVMKGMTADEFAEQYGATGVSEDILREIHGEAQGMYRENIPLPGHLVEQMSARKAGIKPEESGERPIDETPQTLGLQAGGEPEEFQEILDSLGDDTPVPEYLRPQAGDVMDEGSAISTRFPTAVKSTEDPMTHDLVVGLESAMNDPDAFKHNVGLMGRYENFPTMGSRTRPEKKAESIITHMKDNLLRIYDKVPEDTRQRSKLWYVGANKIANKTAEEYNIKPEQAAGVYAALSPQKDWFMNVSLGNRVIDIVQTKGDVAWDQDMEDSLAVIGPKIKNKAHQTAVDAIRGKTLNELEEPVEKALWVRVYDEVKNPRGHQLVMPEGDLGDLVQGQSGEKKTAWGSLNEISNAVGVLVDPSKESISRRMGVQHKVRSFYNNIINPGSDRGDVTIDTHAVAAALMQPLAGKDAQVLHNFGSGVKGQRGPANSSITGNKGTYGIYADAYRRAAEERGVLPREMQSITWEAARGLFKDTLKTPANKKAVSAIWKQFKAGKITQEEAQEQVFEHFGGIDEPAWKQ